MKEKQEEFGKELKELLAKYEFGLKPVITEDGPTLRIVDLAKKSDIIK